MTDLVTAVPAVAVLESDRITQIREEGKRPRDVAWTVTHKGGPGCEQHPDITGLHIGWESADDSTGLHEFKQPLVNVIPAKGDGPSEVLATTWLTVAYVPAASDEAPGEADEDVAEIVDRVTLGVSPSDPAFVADEVAEGAADLCVYCEWPIRETSTGYAHEGEPCGLTPRPIPKPARHAAEPEQVLA